jgi:hypothetical protein
MTVKTWRERSIGVPYRDQLTDFEYMQAEIDELSKLLAGENAALEKLLAELDKKAGSGFIPWEIEDAFAEYMGLKEKTK